MLMRWLRAEVALVLAEAEVAVGLQRVQPGVLQAIRTQLVGQPGAPTFLGQIGRAHV